MCWLQNKGLTNWVTGAHKNREIKLSVMISIQITAQTFLAAFHIVPDTNVERHYTFTCTEQLSNKRSNTISVQLKSEYFCAK